MHPLQAQYVTGESDALVAFGLTKVAIQTQNQQRLKEMEMRNQARLDPNRPRGLAAIQAKATPAQLPPVGNVQQASAGYGARPVGGPGTAQGFQVAGGLPLETPPAEAAHNRALLGIPQQGGAPGIGGAAARAEMATGGTPLLPGRTVIGHLLLPAPN